MGSGPVGVMAVALPKEDVLWELTSLQMEEPSLPTLIPDALPIPRPDHGSPPPRGPDHNWRGPQQPQVLCAAPQGLLVSFNPTHWAQSSGEPVMEDKVNSQENTQ